MQHCVEIWVSSSHQPENIPYQYTTPNLTVFLYWVLMLFWCVVSFNFGDRGNLFHHRKEKKKKQKKIGTRQSEKKLVILRNLEIFQAPMSKTYWEIKKLHPYHLFCVRFVNFLTDSENVPWCNGETWTLALMEFYWLEKSFSEIFEGSTP